MRLFAISDLHLPGGDDKPMNVFGQHWDNHFERIAADWRERVAEEDAVLIPGDISWAMPLKNALPDLQAIGELPGRKVMSSRDRDSASDSAREAAMDSSASNDSFLASSAACFSFHTARFFCPAVIALSPAKQIKTDKTRRRAMRRIHICTISFFLYFIT